MTNELAQTNVNENTGEIIERNNVVEENDDYVIKQKPDGKFIRQAKYTDFSSMTAESREDKLWLLNIMEGDEDTGMGLADNVGKEIVVENIIIRGYDRIDEDSGETENGVLTYLITPEREVYVTSSKTVYFSIKRIMDVFGTPDSDMWENVTIKVGSEKRENGTLIKIKMVA